MKEKENQKESADTGAERRIIMCFDDFFKLYNVTEKDKQELLYRLYANDKKTLLDEFLSKYKSRLEFYIEDYQNEKTVEKSLGGNIVKAAQYGGTVAGLTIALNTIHDIESEVIG